MAHTATRHSDRDRDNSDPFRDGFTYRQQFTCCGKGACRACRGVAFTHGPYWYAEARVGKNGRRTKTIYIGTTLRPVADVLRDRQERARRRADAERERRERGEEPRRARRARRPAAPPPPRPDAPPRDRFYWDGGYMSQADALRIMGLSASYTGDQLRAAFRELAREYHPDTSKHPDALRIMKAINRAHERLGGRGR